MKRLKKEKNDAANKGIRNLFRLQNENKVIKDIRNLSQREKEGKYYKLVILGVTVILNMKVKAIYLVASEQFNEQ